MKILIVILMLFSSSLYADWIDLYNQEKKVYSNTEKELLKRFSALPKKEMYSQIIGELKKRGSIYYLNKYAELELELGVTNPKHFIWLLETFIKTNSQDGVHRSHVLWKKHAKSVQMTKKQKLYYNYSVFYISKESDLSSKQVKSLLNTNLHDTVINKVLYRKLAENKFKKKELIEIMQMKSKLMYEDKMFLAVLGECKKFGKEFKKYCNLKGKKLKKLQEKYPEVVNLSLL